mmetsp:Transcript_890/g.1772  ORF Transcript_890/g.1772 Transcript_890/m.1772 type:complete len:82 (-) Transcript_890:45-290(-)
MDWARIDSLDWYSFEHEVDAVRECSCFSLLIRLHEASRGFDRNNHCKEKCCPPPSSCVRHSHSEAQKGEDEDSLRPIKCET